MAQYGYRIVNAKAVIDESEAEKVKMLYYEFLATGSMRNAAIKVEIDKVHSVIPTSTSNQARITV